MEGNGERKFDKRLVLAAITVTIVAILLMLTFVFPDQNGKLHSELEAGDFFVLESTRYVERFTIDEINGDQLEVTLEAYSIQEGTTDVAEIQMTTKEFWSWIYLDDEKIGKASDLGATYRDTLFGKKLCMRYGYMMNIYNVDEYGVIYYSTIGGNFWSLSDTSLLYGHEPQNKEDLSEYEGDE